MRVEESEIYQDMKQYSQNTRAENIRISTEYLKKNKIKTYLYKNGTHLIIKSYTEIIDFLPGVGLWRSRKMKKDRFGVRNLVKYVKNIPGNIPEQLKLW